MKKQTLKYTLARIFAAVIITLGLIGRSAFAADVTLPFYDGFPSSLSEGNLGPGAQDAANWSIGSANNGGLLTGATNSSQIVVSNAAALSYTGLQSPASGSKGVRVKYPAVAAQYDVGGSFSPITSGSVYVSYLMKVVTLPSANRVMFAMTQPFTTIPNTTPKLAISLNSGGALFVNKGANSAPTQGTTANLGTTASHLVVARYTFNAALTNDDVVDLWLDPSPSTFGGGSAPTATLAGVSNALVSDATSITNFYIHVVSSGTAGEWSVDEVRVGTSWASVTPGVSAANTSLDASPANVNANGTAASTITVTVKDASGNPMPNIPAANVVLSKTGSAVLTQPSSATDANGQTTATVVDSTAEVTTISAVVYGFSITQTTNVTFANTATAPSVTTQAASSTNTTSATLNGTITTDNGGAINDYGFYWSASPGVSSANTRVQVGTSAFGSYPATFSSSLTGLSVNTVYYYRAYAANSVGESVGGADVSFYTRANTPTTPSVSSITRNSVVVTLGAGDGNPSATTYAIQDSTSGNYVQANGTLSGSAVYQTAATWGSPSVSGLSAGTTYTFRVKAQNGAGVDTAFSSTATAVTTADFRTATSGNWNSASSWETNSGASWFAAATTPGQDNAVYIQSGHTVTLTGNEACADLHICAGSTVVLTNTMGMIALGANTLSVYGKFRSYTNAVGSIPGSNNGGGFGGYPFTASAGGKVSVVGTTRTLNLSGEWSANIGDETYGTFPLEINCAGQTVTLASSTKASSWTLAAGTLNSAGQRVAVGTGAAGTGDITVKNGATWISSANGTTSGNQVASRTGGTRAGTLTIEAGGLLQLSGTQPTVDFSTFNLGGTVEYNKAATANLLSASGNDPGAAVPNTYSNLIVSGTGAKTNLANITVNGTLTISGSTLLVGANTLTLNGPAIAGTPANLITTTNSSLSFGGSSSGITIPNGVTALNNLTIANPSGVTLGAAVNMVGQLQVNSGILDLGSFSSSAGSLSFDSGNSAQAIGTWGNTGSGAANVDAAHFAGTGTVNVLYSLSSLSQFRSRTTGNWNASLTWEMSTNGTTWIASPSLTPSTNNVVFVQTTNIVTLTANAACSNINIAVASTNGSTGGSTTRGQVSLGTNTLQLFGKLRAYFAATGTVPGTDTASGSSFNPFIKTAASAGKVKVVGTSRALTTAGQWGAFNLTGTTMADLEVAPDAGQTLTADTEIRFGNINFASGTFSTSAQVGADNGTVGVGGASITIGANATVITSASGTSVFRRSATSTSASFGAFTVNGLLQLSGTNPKISAGSIDMAGSGSGTVEYIKSGSGNQNLLIAGAGDTGAVDPTNYGNIKLTTAGNKTNQLNINVAGVLTVNTNVGFVLNGKTVTLGAAPSLNGSLTLDVTKTAPSTFTSAKLVQTSGTLAYYGTLNLVTNAGTAFSSGDVIDLFDAPAFSGGFTNVTLPAGSSAHWSTNSLTVDGSVLFTNNAPTLSNASVNRGSGVTAKVKKSDFAAADLDGDALTYTLGTSTNGATITQDTTYLFIPANTVNDQFTVTVSDAFGGANSATVTVAIVNTTGQTTGNITLSGGNANVTFYGIPGTNYTIQVSSDLSTWSDLTTVTAASTGVITYTDTAPPTPNAYYRLKF